MIANVVAGSRPNIPMFVGIVRALREMIRAKGVVQNVMNGSQRRRNFFRAAESGGALHRYVSRVTSSAEREIAKRSWLVILRPATEFAKGGQDRAGNASRMIRKRCVIYNTVRPKNSELKWWQHMAENAHVAEKENCHFLLWNTLIGMGRNIVGWLGLDIKFGLILDRVIGPLMVTPFFVGIVRWQHHVVARAHTKCLDNSLP